MKKILCLIFALALLCAAAAFGDELPGLSIHFFENGKADAILLREGNSTVLIDTGFPEKAEALAQRLRELGVTSIDKLIISHYDRDHVGGAALLVRSFDVQEVIGPDYRQKSEALSQLKEELKSRDLKLSRLRQEKELQVGSMDITLYPAKKHTGMVPNNSSIICSVTYGKTSFLFTGDALETRMKDFNRKNNRQFTLIKLPHHGIFLRKSAEFKKLLSATQPQYGIATNSPAFAIDQDLALMLEIYCLKLYETKNGELTVTSNGETLTITQSEPRLPQSSPAAES